MLVEIY